MHSVALARILAVALALALAAPAAAQDAPVPAPQGEVGEGLDLLGEGARRLLRGLTDEMEPALRDLGAQIEGMRPVLDDLARMIGDVRNYHAPEMLPNGDILIRRRQPEALPAPGPGGDLEI